MLILCWPLGSSVYRKDHCRRVCRKCSEWVLHCLSTVTTHENKMCPWWIGKVERNSETRWNSNPIIIFPCCSFSGSHSFLEAICILRQRSFVYYTRWRGDEFYWRWSESWRHPGSVSQMAVIRCKTRTEASCRHFPAREGSGTLTACIRYWKALTTSLCCITFLSIESMHIVT